MVRYKLAHFYAFSEKNRDGILKKPLSKGAISVKASSLK